MRFFNITIKVKDAKQIKDFKPEEAACASGKLFEENPACFVYVRGTRKTVVDAIACVDSSCDEKKFAKTFAEKLFDNIADIKVSEGKMFDFVNNIGDAEIDSYLTDSSATIDRLGLGFFYEICHGSFDERIVTEHKTKTSVYADVNKYFLDEEYKRELDRIYAGKTLKKPIGNPAHYFMVSNDDDARMVRNRNLVFSLFYKGRINTKKYTIIGLRDRRISEWHIEQLYRINADGVIVLRVDEDILFESETRNYKWRWSGIVNIIKRYASSVVTIISMDNASMNTRNKIISSLHGIALIKFYDQEYKGESAVDCFCEIARQNGTNAPESEIEKIRKSDRMYSKRSLQTIYSDWYNEYVATVQFPEYTAYFNGKGGEDDTLNEKSAYDKLSEMIGLVNVKKVIDDSLREVKGRRGRKSKVVLIEEMLPTENVSALTVEIEKILSEWKHLEGTDVILPYIFAAMVRSNLANKAHNYRTFHAAMQEKFPSHNISNGFNWAEAVYNALISEGAGNVDITESQIQRGKKHVTDIKLRLLSAVNPNIE